MIEIAPPKTLKKSRSESLNDFLNGKAAFVQPERWPERLNDLPLTNCNNYTKNVSTAERLPPPRGSVRSAS
jgi:hypothetical protein